MDSNIRKEKLKLFILNYEDKNFWPDNIVRGAKEDKNMTSRIFELVFYPKLTHLLHAETSFCGEIHVPNPILYSCTESNILPSQNLYIILDQANEVLKNNFECLDWLKYECCFTQFGLMDNSDSCNMCVKVSMSHKDDLFDSGFALLFPMR